MFIKAHSIKQNRVLEMFLWHTGPILPVFHIIYLNCLLLIHFIIQNTPNFSQNLSLTTSLSFISPLYDMILHLKVRVVEQSKLLTVNFSYLESCRLPDIHNYFSSVIFSGLLLCQFSRFNILMIN